MRGNQSYNDFKLTNSPGQKEQPQKSCLLPGSCLELVVISLYNTIFNIHFRSTIIEKQMKKKHIWCNSNYETQLLIFLILPVCRLLNPYINKWVVTATSNLENLTFIISMTAKATKRENK